MYYDTYQLYKYLYLYIKEIFKEIFHTITDKNQYIAVNTYIMVISSLVEIIECIPIFDSLIKFYHNDIVLLTTYYSINQNEIDLNLF